MSEQNRRDFLMTVGALSATSTAFAAKSDSRASGRVIGANDRINVGVIGCGGRGSLRRQRVRAVRREEQRRLPDRGGLRRL